MGSLLISSVHQYNIHQSIGTVWASYWYLKSKRFMFSRKFTVILFRILQYAIKLEEIKRILNWDNVFHVGLFSFSFYLFFCFLLKQIQNYTLHVRDFGFADTVIACWCLRYSLSSSSADIIPSICDLTLQGTIKTRNKLWMKILIVSLSIGVCVYVLWQDGPAECCTYIAENTVHEEWSILKWIVFLLRRSWHPRLYSRTWSLKISLQTFSQTQWNGVS